tara:strand:+ start:1697 stop:2932 length:1236 start_codon:yes stop_codon:yes gene_type:complete
LLKNIFVKRVLTLLTGTTLAQALPILLSPILTRLYTPAEFGQLGVVVAITAIFGIVAGWRMEFAIMQPKSENDAFRICSLTMALSIFNSMLTFVFLVLLNDKLEMYLDDAILNMIYLIPVSVALMGVCQSLNYLNNRFIKFKLIAQGKVFQSVGNVSTSITYASYGSGSLGLVLGHVIGQAVHLTIMSKTYIQWLKGKSSLKYNLLRTYSLIKKYKKYPLISAPGALVDTVSLQSPVIFVNKIFDSTAAGYFSFIYRIIGGPLALVSAAISQVLLQKITAEKSNTVNQLLKLVRVLLIPALFTVLLLNFYGEFIFGFVFGEEWRVAGSYAAVISFSVAIRFMVTPLSMVMAIEKNLKLGFLWQAIYLFVIVSLYFFFHNGDFDAFLHAYVIADVLMYFLYFYFILIGAKRI